MYVHIGWGRWFKGDHTLNYIFCAGIKKPDNVHSWFKVYKNE